MTTTPATPTKRSRKAKDSDLVYVEGVGTTLPAETPKPARKPRASKSSAQLAVVPEPVVETTPEPVAPKRTARQRKADALAAEIVAAVDESNATAKPVAVKPEPKPSFAATVEATELLVLHEAMLLAAAAFEVRIVELIEAGVSPSAIGNVTGIPTSSVRRLIKRRHPDLVK
jgi:hypothetical protein